MSPALERTRNPGCCSDLQLDRLITGELDAGARASVESHTTNCELCRARLTALREDRSQYVASHTALPPALRQASEPARHVWSWPGWLGGLALVGATAGMLMVLVVRPPAEQTKGGERLEFYVKHGEEVRLFMRFRDWLGKYPMHCHNLTHEDHAMMLRWDVVPG